MFYRSTNRPFRLHQARPAPRVRHGLPYIRGESYPRRVKGPIKYSSIKRWWKLDHDGRKGSLRYLRKHW